MQSFPTYSVIYVQHVPSLTTCAGSYNNMFRYTYMYNMSHPLQHMQSFTTYSVIYVQHVPSLTTCAVIYSMFSNICTTCSVPYNMCRQLRQHVPLYMYNMSHPLQHVHAVTTTCSVIYLQHVQSFIACCVIYNMSRPLQHV
jgi:hypothetical protein